MELRQLKYFLKAKELLNFTEAANAVNISQSTLSQQIKQLEEELNVPLFNRIGKRITLTEAGELFAEYASQSVSSSNDGLQLIKDLNDLITGTLSIGVTYALRNPLTQALISFCIKYPQIHLQIIFGTSAELLEKLKRMELDFILTFNESTKDKHLKYQLLFSAPMTLVVSKNSSLAHKKQISLKEMMSVPLIIPSRGYSTIRFMNEAFAKNNLQPTFTIEINDIPTLLELVKTGRWNTILTSTSVNDYDLVTIPIKAKDMIRKAMIISLNDAYEKKAAKKFLALLKENNIS